ncbi:RagB/SusD family nutrient uptake outer membrane protein [Sphingobacterium sp. DK4209]|uniref:RagB/SusD family nutrient uptake outer membrane protein n=1 Tax=Sphingobacterium zhuxiongii TaxID=2662364 RepID=A0A5Q0QH86_9SPHI|nr:MULTISPECIES: RagB/SusD family nutrient uptake outer membrane protein [unclassified Sphingobacterium]MVZ64783.1 RagB/SusD family nutrient uptake outer membrane protein [Sphingobacterium sp. DK4209]QGA27112.1 RagB/SusD family nutrient uptake outer membrane protein [Sphingobacterium sp. dk4302]
MKKIGILVASALLMTSCEKFLDTESLNKKNTGNFPVTVADANQMLTGIYSALSRAITNVPHTHFYMAELASDDRFGGGGENDRDMQGLDHLMNTQPDRFLTFWTARYEGILRTNTAIETLDKVSGWSTEAEKNQVLGEVHFMRALYYFELAQMFGEVPLLTASVASIQPKASADALFAQIGSDLKKAIELIPTRAYNAVPSGHATKWAAQALLARSYLFYTGYYKKTAMPLADGSSLAKAQVIQYLEDCIQNSGHNLVPEFRNLWPYSNEHTAKDYQYAKDNNLKWVGDGNIETVFAVKFGTLADWGDQYILGYTNQYLLHFGLRSNNGQAGTFPFGQGWGAGPVNTSLWNDWRQAEPTDIRRTASIINADTDLQDYIYGADNQMEETGLWQKKYIPVTAYSEGKLIPSYAILSDAAAADYQLAHTQDLVLIRFSDVLLMHAELKEDATNLNRVRARAKLPAVAYSLAALKRERRWELAFEGLRYFDLMRWHDAAEALGKQEGITIKNKGVNTAMKAFGGGYKARFEATGGFWPIPNSEITLTDGVLTQNKGWGTPAAEFTGW